MFGRLLNSLGLGSQDSLQDLHSATYAKWSSVVEKRLRGGLLPALSALKENSSSKGPAIAGKSLASALQSVSKDLQEVILLLNIKDYHKDTATYRPSQSLCSALLELWSSLLSLLPTVQSHLSEAVHFYHAILSICQRREFDLRHLYLTVNDKPGCSEGDVTVYKRYRSLLYQTQIYINDLLSDDYQQGRHHHLNNFCATFSALSYFRIPGMAHALVAAMALPDCQMPDFEARLQEKYGLKFELPRCNVEIRDGHVAERRVAGLFPGLFHWHRFHRALSEHSGEPPSPVPSQAAAPPIARPTDADQDTEAPTLTMTSIPSESDLQSLAADDADEFVGGPAKTDASASASSAAASNPPERLPAESSESSPGDTSASPLASAPVAVPAQPTPSLSPEGSPIPGSSPSLSLAPGSSPATGPSLTPTSSFDLRRSSSGLRSSSGSVGDRAMQALLLPAGREAAWIGVLQQREQLFFLFLKEWLSLLHRAASKDRKLALPLTSVYGFPALLFAFLYEMERRETWTRPLLDASVMVLVAYDRSVINLFQRFRFSRTAVHQLMGVIDCISTLQQWLQELHARQLVLPPTYDCPYLCKAVDVIIDSDHHNTIARLLSMFYYYAEVFQGEVRRQIFLDCLLRKHFFQLFLHWDSNVRNIFHQFIVFKVLRSKRSELHRSGVVSVHALAGVERGRSPARGGKAPANGPQQQQAQEMKPLASWPPVDEADKKLDGMIVTAIEESLARVQEQASRPPASAMPGIDRRVAKPDDPTSYDPHLEVYAVRALVEYKNNEARYHQWELSGAIEYPQLVSLELLEAAEKNLDKL